MKITSTLKKQSYTLCEKCPYSDLFWSAFSRNRTEYFVSLRIQSECGKIWTRITPNTDILCSGTCIYDYSNSTTTTNSIYDPLGKSNFSVGVVRKMFSENMNQIYRRTPMYDFYLVLA